MKDSTKLNLSVGLFVLAGIASLTMLAYKVGNLGSYNVAGTYPLTANFSDIGRVGEKSPIRCAGVLIGHVTKITMDADRFQARVSMTMDSRYQFPKDTFANIQTAGVLGEQYIAFAPGGDSEMLKSGDEIRQTQSALILENMISKFMYNKAAADH